MKLHQLLYFLEAAKQLHVGRAAKVLSISPSAVSHGISSLEEELGRDLFAKKGKNIRLTDHGKLLVERATALLMDVERIREELASESAELQGNYRMAASHVLSSDVLTPAWVKLQAAHPRIQGEIYTMRSAGVYQGILSGEFDFGLCFSPQRDPGVEIMPIYEGQLVIAVRKGHPVFKSKTKTAIEQIGAFPAVLPKYFQGIENCESHLVFSRHQIVPKVSTLFDSYDVALSNVKQSDAWSFLPDWIANRYGLKVVTADEWEAPVSISAIWSTERMQTRFLRQMVANLRELF